MAQVVSILRDTSRFADFSVRVTVTHTEGEVLKRVATNIRAMASFLAVLVRRFRTSYVMVRMDSWFHPDQSISLQAAS
jgi:hypothetical protein